MARQSRTGNRTGRAQAARAAMRGTAQDAEGVMHSVAESDEFVGDVGETVARTADATVDITRRVADQGREVIWLGMRAAAGVNGRLADVSYGSGHRLIEQAARMVDIYSQASETTAEKLRQMFAAYLSVGHGIQQMQQAWLDLLNRSINEASHRPQDLLRCKSFVEVADTQRDLYVSAVEGAMEASTTMLQLAERVAREAMAPLQSASRGGARG